MNELLTEINFAVARKVMGWDWVDQVAWEERPREGYIQCVGSKPGFFQDGNCPHIAKLLPRYSVDASAAMEVVEKTGLLDEPRALTKNMGGIRSLPVGAWAVVEVRSDGSWTVLGSGVTAPLAICYAALVTTARKEGP